MMLKIWIARFRGLKVFRVQYQHDGQLPMFTCRLPYWEAKLLYEKHFRASAVDVVYAPQWFADSDPPLPGG
jgi:hypothetical protein